MSTPTGTTVPTGPANRRNRRPEPLASAAPVPANPVPANPALAGSSRADIDATQPHVVYVPTPWSDDVWFLAHDGRCLGWIRRYTDGPHVLFGVYTYGCDERGLRVWVTSTKNLQAAAGYMAENVRELIAASRRLAPDPVNPLGLHERR